MRTRLWLLPLCALLLCACTPQGETVAAPPSDTASAGESAPPAGATPTPLADAPWLVTAETTLTPTPTQTPTPTPVEPYYVGCADDGVSGVGAVRGNTNGNLAIGGRAVCDGTHIYYIEGWRGKRILRYDMATGEETVLRDDIADAAFEGYHYLNLLDGKLYFVRSNRSSAPDEVCCYDLSQAEQTVLYQAERIGSLLVAYGKAFLCVYPRPCRTAVLDCTDGGDVRWIDGVAVLAAMDGLLYGRWDAAADEEESIVAIDAYGNVVRRYLGEILDAPLSFVPVEGKLVIMTGYLNGEEWFDNISRVWVFDVEADAHVEFDVPMECAGYLNADADGIYLQRYMADECGDIYRIQFDGTGFASFDRRAYHNGCSLYGDEPLLNYVPCDDAGNESVTEAWEREMQTQRGGE